MFNCFYVTARVCIMFIVVLDAVFIGIWISQIIRNRALEPDHFVVLK